MGDIEVVAQNSEQQMRWRNAPATIGAHFGFGRVESNFGASGEFTVPLSFQTAQMRAQSTVF